MDPAKSNKGFLFVVGGKDLPSPLNSSVEGLAPHIAYKY